MRSLPKISVIVPSYNQGRFIAECLNSIVDQNYPFLELIIIDGGSTDESVDVIRSFEEHITFWRSERDDGQSAAINEGMMHASGDLIAWLNSDDLYCPLALWKIGQAWVKYPGYKLYIGNGTRLDEKTGIATPFQSRNMALDRKALREGVDYLQQPSVFFDRAGWAEEGGLDPSLHYCMDWDIFIRMADAGPTVIINDFLSISRQYEDTKTSAGRLTRVDELIRMAERHTGKTITPGGIFYALQTLLDHDHRKFLGDDTARDLEDAYETAQLQLAKVAGNPDGFPSASDPQDTEYVPIPVPGGPRPEYRDGQLPRISIITPSFNQAQYLERTLRSVRDQNYPNLEHIVMDGGSTDRSIEILREYDDYLTYWESEPDRGPAHAINKGFARATGDILLWLNSDDMLAENSLWTVSELFRSKPDIDLVYGNALYVDELDRPLLMNHGPYRTSQYYGVMQPRDDIPEYWGYIHSVPQPATFFRRSLLDRAGALDEDYKFIFDFELFFRFQEQGKVTKSENLLAFYRIHAAAKTSGWHHFLLELFRFSRAWWPSGAEDFAATRDRFLDAAIGRYWGGQPRNREYHQLRERCERAIEDGSQNPELLLHDWFNGGVRLAEPSVPESDPVEPPAPPLVKPEIEPLPKFRFLSHDVRRPRYNVLFSSYFLPRFPGRSGGEIRDLHILAQLLRFARLSFYSSFILTPNDQENVLAPYLLAYHDPNNVDPQLIDQDALAKLNSSEFLEDQVRYNAGEPVVGPTWHRDAATSEVHTRAFMLRGLTKAIVDDRPDFVFASPQPHSLPILLDGCEADRRTRIILATYDVEKVRLRRLNASKTGVQRIAGLLENRRAGEFESDNIAASDGIIAVSELDREIFVREYAIDPERVLVIENAVDTDYFDFRPRPAGGPLIVTFIASFGYEPNYLAAIRLVRDIMPLVWREQPEAQVWIVGQYPPADLEALADNRRIFVTGSVPSVRPYLADATVMCAPLEAGSGTKYKVLESLSAGVPVVCSSLAAEGLDLVPGTHFALGDSDADLARRIIEVAGDPSLSARLCREGRRLVEAYYSWDTVLQALEPWLERIASMPKKRRSSK